MRVIINQLRTCFPSGNGSTLRAPDVRGRPLTPLIPRMIFSRPWLPLFVAGCLLPGTVLAQDNAGAAPAGSVAGGAAAGGAAAGSPAGAPAAGSASPGASSAFGTAPSAPSAGTIPSAPNQGTLPFGTQNPPGQGPQNPSVPGAQPGTPNGQPTPDNTTAGGSASAFGNTESPGTGAQLQQAPASFSVPGFYGRGAQTFTVGEGRLARPKFRFSGNIAVGYDDNVFTTPTHGVSVPTQKVEVLQTPGTPAGSVQVLVPSGDPNVPATVQTVQIPATAPKFRTVTIPGVPAPERIASWITRTDAKWDVQMANRRTLFTFDLGGGVDYYWNRPGKKADYTGQLSMVYLRKLTGRAQFTFSADASYQSQPDFSQIDQPTNANVGSYLTANLKADLSYRLTPRFSTVTSVSYNTLRYQEQTQSSANYANTTFGTELRYLFSPRVTLLGELRYSSDLHQNDNTLNTDTYYALIGGEVALSRRFSATLRLGEEVEKFKEGGDQNSSPYAEATLNYRITPQTAVSWTARYGYEEAGVPNSSNLVARTGIQLTQIFTPRLQGVLNVNLLRSELKTTSTSSSTSTTNGSTSTSSSSLTSDSVQDTIDASLGFYYTLDRHWSLNLTYSYTTVIGPETFFDYYRSRVFLGASYQF